MGNWKKSLKCAIGRFKLHFKKGNASPESDKQSAHAASPPPTSTSASLEEPNTVSSEKPTSHASAADNPRESIEASAESNSRSRDSGLPALLKINENIRPNGVGNLKSSSVKALRRKDPTFPAPDMSRLTIQHRDKTSSNSQAWQAIGRQQSLYSSQNKGKAVCTIGLDFGTAFTKVCFQFRGAHYVVDWRLAVPACTPPLLPGVFSIKPDGECILGDWGGAGLSGLKLALLQTRDAASQINVLAFLALVLRYARAQCFTEHKAAFTGFTIEWFLNIGLPTEPWQDRGTSELYERLALAAWNLSASAFTISLKSARAALESVESGKVESELIFGARIKSFPEFVGQIASYVHSAQRRSDLHLLVDVGAGTVDIALFHIGRDEAQDNAFLIHKSSIEPLGTHILLGYRVEASRSLETLWDDEFAGLSTSSFEAKAKLRRGCLVDVDAAVSEKLFLKMRWLISQTKQHRYQTAPVWKDGLPFLLCGGGRNMDVYRDAIKQVTSQWKLQELQLKPPASLVARGIGAADFHRVSVAHGLSFTADNLGQIVREEDVPDIRHSNSSRANLSENYIDK
jgi:hypothetical protein